MSTSVNVLLEKLNNLEQKIDDIQLSADDVKLIVDQRVNKLQDEINEKLAINASEVSLLLAEVRQAFQIFSGSITVKKAPVPRKKAIKDDSSEEDESEVVEKAAKALTITRWFEDRYAEDEEFRDKYLTEDAKKLVESNAGLKKKTGEAQVKGAAGVVYRYHSKEKTPEFDLLKKAHKDYKDNFGK